MTSTLPEPSFIERDISKITQEWISLYEQKCAVERGLPQSDDKNVHA